MGAFLFSECILVSSEVSHLIATLVKRLWPSYLPGLHIPATRWIWIFEGIPGPLRHMCHMPYCNCCLSFHHIRLGGILGVLTQPRRILQMDEVKFSCPECSGELFDSTAIPEGSDSFAGAVCGNCGHVVTEDESSQFDTQLANDYFDNLTRNLFD
ncbi:ECs_2282 family putative zinc-binding protein [Enterobacter hormaechei]|uniref:ECs_2282 family putative zinc-binding protein n=3 Tax=Enterobacter TaxID=547 RepID=UPI0039C33A67